MADKRRERSLPDGVTEMILVRLPARDLTCYKLVCKRWCSLISSPYFASAHLTRSKPDPSRHHILVQDETLLRLQPPLPGPFESFIYCYSLFTLIIGSINGLICAVSHYRGASSTDNIWILNPVTGHSKKLPLSKSPLNVFTRAVTFAFLWDSSSDDYKVVKIVSSWDDDDVDDDAIIVAKVWDSSSPVTWTDITVKFCRPFYIFRKRVSYCDVIVEGFGAYWIVVDRSLQDLFVLFIDMTTLTLEQISLPHLSMPHETFIREVNRIDSPTFFGANWKGSFAFVEWDFGTTNRRMYNLWVLLDHGGSSEPCWRKDFSFDVDFCFDRCLNCVNGQLILERRGGDGNGVALFDMETRGYEVLRGVASVASAHGFVESFVSIKGFKPLEEGLITVKWPYKGAATSRKF